MSAGVMLPVSVRLLYRTGVRPIVPWPLMHLAEKLSPPFRRHPSRVLHSYHTQRGFRHPNGGCPVHAQTTFSCQEDWSERGFGNHGEQRWEARPPKASAVGN